MLQRVMAYMEHQVRAKPDSLYTTCAELGCESALYNTALHVLSSDTLWLVFGCRIISSHSPPLSVPLPPSLSHLYPLGFLQPQTMAASIRTESHSWQSWRELQGHMLQQR